MRKYAVSSGEHGGWPTVTQERGRSDAHLDLRWTVVSGHSWRDMASRRESDQTRVGSLRMCRENVFSVFEFVIWFVCFVLLGVLNDG